MSNQELKNDQRVIYKKLRAKSILQSESSIKEKINKVIEIRLQNNLLKGFLGIYWPLNGEVDLRYLKDLKVPLALPASSKNGRMTFHKWGEKPLKKDFNGIPAPLNEKTLVAQEVSLLLVPALAIDKDCYRLGYGGGFYDRLRAEKDWRAIPSLVITPKRCFSRSPLPKDKWDIPFDGWINEEEFFDPLVSAKPLSY